MGMSTDAILAYGVNFDEGELQQVAPWYDNDFGAELCSWDDWILTNYLEYKNGLYPGKDKHLDYFADRRCFLEDNPYPIKVVTHCCYDARMYIVAVPDTVSRASRGYPEVIYPENMLTVSLPEAYTTFMDKYKLWNGQKAGWWLCSDLY